MTPLFNRIVSTSAPCALVLAMIVSGLGCGGDDGENVSASGDPTADQRADQVIRNADGDGKDQNRTLYDRLGGEAKIVAIVDDMTERVIADPRVNFERRNVKKNWVGGHVDPWEATTESVDRFKRHMVEFLALAAGGPAEYTGRDMATVHKAMRITNNEFDAMVGDIKASMDRLGVATREQRDLLAIVETTRKQIVESP